MRKGVKNQWRLKISCQVKIKFVATEISTADETCVKMVMIGETWYEQYECKAFSRSSGYRMSILGIFRARSQCQATDKWNIDCATRMLSTYFAELVTEPAREMLLMKQFLLDYI